MTSMTLKQAEKDFTGMVRRVTDRHEAVVLKRGAKAVAVLVPADEYLTAQDDAIPASFWQGLKDIESGRIVDMETALNEAPSDASFQGH